MEQHLSQGLSDMRLDAIVKTKIIDLIQLWKSLFQIGSYRWISVMICRTKNLTVRIILILIKCICLHACSVCEDRVGKYGIKWSQGAKTNEWKFQVYIEMEVIKTVAESNTFVEQFKDRRIANLRTKARNQTILVQVRLLLIPHKCEPHINGMG